MGTRGNKIDLSSNESLELGIRLTRAGRRLIRDLVRARDQRGYSGKQLADAIGIHKSGVTRFEQQETSPRLDTVLRYAHAVGADVTFSVEPVGGWVCEDPAVVTRIDTWASAPEEVHEEPSDRHWERQLKVSL